MQVSAIEQITTREENRGLKINVFQYKSKSQRSLLVREISASVLSVPFRKQYRLEARFILKIHYECTRLKVHWKSESHGDFDSCICDPWPEEYVAGKRTSEDSRPLNKGSRSHFFPSWLESVRGFLERTEERAKGGNH